MLTVEMSFLPAAKVPCDACDGRRFNGETLAAAFKGKSIADVLALTVEEAAEFFRMKKVGLDYLALGQSSPTLSVGSLRSSTSSSPAGTPSSESSTTSISPRGPTG